MGASMSKKIPGIVWCDIEGGVRGSPVWDISFVRDSPDGIQAAVRYCCLGSNTKHVRRSLTKSLPTGMFSKLKKDNTLQLQYTTDGKSCNKQTVSNCSLESLVQEYMAEHSDHWFVAWNMKGHDMKILKAIVGEKASEITFVDPLPVFRTRIGLPKNSIASFNPGTPRHLFAVDHGDIGPAHTSMVDTLNLRLLTHRFCWCLHLQDDGADLSELLDKPSAKHVSASPETYDSIVDVLSGFGVSDIPSKPDAWSGSVPKEVIVDSTLDWVNHDEWWIPQPLKL